MKRIAGLFVAFAAAVLMAACGERRQGSDTIPVAVVGPVTGQYASFGAQMKNGGEMAVDDINAAGGVLGKKLDLEIGDDACDPKQAVAVANQMTGNGVALVAGHYCSGSSIPASKVYAEANMVQISPASTNPAFTDDRAGPNIYRVCGRDDQQGGVAGKYLAEPFRRQEHRLRPRQDGLRQRPRRRDQEGDQRGRQAGGRCTRRSPPARRTIRRSSPSSSRPISISSISAAITPRPA